MVNGTVPYGKWLPGGMVVKNLPAYADERDLGSTPVSERSPGVGSGSRIPAWRIPQTEESGGLQSMGLQRLRHD